MYIYIYIYVYIVIAMCLSCPANSLRDAASLPAPKLNEFKSDTVGGNYSA